MKKGYKLSPETKEKMSMSRKAYLEQHPEAMHGEHHPRWNGGKMWYLYSLSRKQWESINGPIPKGYSISHKDGDISNNNIDNLVLAPINTYVSEYKRNQMKKNHADFSGEQHPRWKDGTTYTTDGYAQLWSPEEKRGRIKNRVKEHILIAERILGRRLKRSECVHHVNGKKNDNRHQNLVICTHKYHGWLHARMAKLYQEMMFGPTKA